MVNQTPEQLQLLFLQIVFFLSVYTLDIFSQQYKPCGTEPCIFHTEIFQEQKGLTWFNQESVQKHCYFYVCLKFRVL